MQQYTTTRDDHRIASLTALAITIHIAESALPAVLPGVKPGLANIVTIVVLVKFGWRNAVWVNLLRVIVGSLVLGTFMSPTFIMSVSGAMASVSVLGLLQVLPACCRCSAMGYSVTAAMAHMLAQFWVAYGLFIQHAGLFHLLPLLMTAALVFGVASGIIALIILQHLTTDADTQHR